MALSLGIALEKSCEQERRKEFEQRITKSELERDIEWTGPLLIVVGREEDGTFRRYHYTRIVDHDGILKVQIRDMDDKLILGEIHRRA